MSSLRNRIFTTLAVLVVACAQVFGMQRGFVCGHQEVEAQTTAEHCHRITDSGHDEFAPCEKTSSKDCADDKDTEHHAPKVELVQVDSLVLATISAPAFTAILAAEIPFHEWVPVKALTVTEITSRPLDTGGGIPPAALQVARCMVQLV